MSLETIRSFCDIDTRRRFFGSRPLDMIRFLFLSGVRPVRRTRVSSYVRIQNYLLYHSVYPYDQTTYGVSIHDPYTSDLVCHWRMDQTGSWQKDV